MGAKFPSAGICYGAEPLSALSPQLGYGIQLLAPTIPRNWWLGVEPLATPTTAFLSDKEPRTSLHSTLDPQYRVLPFAASPELSPDTLILFMEPDLVLTIEHSLRMAIDIHNEEKRRQKATEELVYSQDEVEAYAEVYRAWMAADKFKRESNSKNKAAWPSWFELDPKTKAFMQYLYRPKDNDSQR